MNYHEHLKEMKTPVPEKPAAFTKSVASIIASGDPIILPPSNPSMVDWEGEFTVVIGKPCHRVKTAQALEYVAGYTIVNDVSARDWVAPIFSSTGIMGPIHAWEHNILGKQFPTFCPMGPTLATRDEIADPEPALEQTFPQEDYLPDGNPGPADRLGDLAAPLLDPLGDPDLPLAGEEWRLSHLSEVHPDRIIGPTHRRGGQVHFGFDPARRGLRHLLRVRPPRLPGGIDDLDIHLVQSDQDPINLLGRGDVLREMVIDLLVGQISLLLPQADKGLEPLHSRLLCHTALPLLLSFTLPSGTPEDPI